MAVPGGKLPQTILVVWQHASVTPRNSAEERHPSLPAGIQKERPEQSFRYGSGSSSESVKKIVWLNDADIPEGLQFPQMAIAGNDQVSSAG